MMPVLLGVIALFALLTLALAVREAVAMVRLSPAAAGLGNYFMLGWWKFNRLKAKIAPAAEPHLEIYKRAIVAFVVFIILGLVVSGFATRANSDPTVATNLIPIHATRPTAVDVADNHAIPARSGALMPVAFRQES